MQLANYILANDLTHEAFAKLVGVERSMVTKWCNRRTIPDAKNMRAIAVATLGSVTANDFHAAHGAEPTPAPEVAA